MNTFAGLLLYSGLCFEGLHMGEPQWILFPLVFCSNTLRRILLENAPEGLGVCGLKLCVMRCPRLSEIGSISILLQTAYTAVQAHLRFFRL